MGWGKEGISGKPYLWIRGENKNIVSAKKKICDLGNNVFTFAGSNLGQSP